MIDMERRNEVMSQLVNGINSTLSNVPDMGIEYVLIIAIPSKDDDSIECSTLTSMEGPMRLRFIARHLNDVADITEKQVSPGLNLDDDTDVQGHS